MTEEIEFIPAKRGPKKKFELWMCDAIIEVARTGGHISTMCETIGIKSENTFHMWKKEYPEFASAYEEARTVSKGVYENLLLQGAMGKIPGFNFNAIAMLMNNKFPDEYKRGANGSNTNSNTEITINQLTLSPEQVQYKINQKLEKLKSLGVNLNLVSKDVN